MNSKKLMNSMNFCEKKIGPEINLYKPVDPAEPAELEYIPRFDCLDMPLADIKYILGPGLFYQFKFENRNIYLFGEAHASLTRSSDIISADATIEPSNTIMFSSFINSLVTQNRGINYDLMVEITTQFKARYSAAEFNTNSPMVNAIVHQFYDCINPDKRLNCNHENLRIHYVDIRDEIDELSKYMPPSDTAALYRQFITTLVKYYDGTKIKKQISAIKNRDAQTALESYIKTMLSDIDIQFSMREELLIMDIYGISRLLREFNPRANPKDIEGKQFIGTSNNIIYYAGAAHIKQMGNFFNNFMKLPLININESLKIQPLSNIPASFIKLDIKDTSFFDHSKKHNTIITNPSFWGWQKYVPSTLEHRGVSLREVTLQDLIDAEWYIKNRSDKYGNPMGHYIDSVKGMNFSQLKDAIMTSNITQVAGDILYAIWIVMDMHGKE